MLELAQQADREAVNALAMPLHAMHVQWRPDIYSMPVEIYSLDRFDAAVKARELFVARIEGVITGYVSLKTVRYEGIGICDRKVMTIEEFCVDEAFRGQGIGTAMMEDVRALAKAFRCTDLQLGVYPQNDAAISFYQKCGFMIRSISMQCKV